MPAWGDETRRDFSLGLSGSQAACLRRSGDVEHCRCRSFEYWTAYSLRVKVQADLDYDFVVTGADMTCTACKKGPRQEKSCTPSKAARGVNCKRYFLTKVCGKATGD